MAANIENTGTGEQARKRVFIVEDHPVFREGLAQMIGREPDMQVCGQAGNAEHGFDEIVRLMPDLALIDLSLPGKNGLALIKEIRQVSKTMRILVVSMHDEALYANRVLRAGGDGYIMKHEDPEEILSAIRDVLAGHTYVSEEIMQGSGSSRTRRQAERTAALDPLSDTQLEILEWLGLGKSTEQIAQQVRATPLDISTELQEIKTKLKLSTDTELIRYAVCWVEGGKSS